MSAQQSSALDVFASSAFTKTEYNVGNSLLTASIYSRDGLNIGAHEVIEAIHMFARPTAAIIPYGEPKSTVLADADLTSEFTKLTMT